MPKYVGDTTNCPGLLVTPQITCIPNGTLHQRWGLEAGYAKIARFGGITADQNKPTNPQYFQMYDSIVNNGMIPVFQVPYDGGNYNTTTDSIIINDLIANNRRVTYWQIGNT
jgi:hypothetical protein